MRSLNKIIKFLTFAIVPIGLALFYSQLHLQGATYQEAVVQTVAAIIGNAAFFEPDIFTSPSNLFPP